MDSQKPVDQIVKKFVADHFNEEPEGKQITILHGQARKFLDPIKPNKVRLSGIISAPADFYNKRKDLHDPNKCHVVYDANSGKITLVVDEQFENDNYKIEGTIIPAPELLQFKINTKHMFGVKELMELLKFNRIYFSDREANAKIVLSLQNFKGKVEKFITDTADLRGNEEKSRITKLEHELEESFQLCLPIYKGGEDVTFRVDVCVSATSADVHVWLESKELKELQQTTRKNMIESELKTFEGIVVIQE